MLHPDHPLAELLVQDKRYDLEAYLFVFESLRYAQEKLGMGTEYERASFDEDEDDDFSDAEPERHVTGQQLCEAMRQYAHVQYGYMAKCVLNSWGVRSTSDFGEIVFNLIKIEQMRKTDHDRREDFDNVFDFEEGFQKSFQFSLPEGSDGREC